MPPESSVVPFERIAAAIYVFRGQKVMLDRDLANLYGVETKALKQAVNRNRDRFPDDFMYVLTREELAILRSRIVTSSSWGGPRYLPMAFTEQGVASKKEGEGERCELKVAQRLIANQADLTDTLITADPLNCQTRTAQQIVERGGDFLLQVKDNQKSVHRRTAVLTEKLPPLLPARKKRMVASTGTSSPSAPSSPSTSTSPTSKP